MKLMRRISSIRTRLQDRADTSKQQTIVNRLGARVIDRWPRPGQPRALAKLANARRQARTN